MKSFISFIKKYCYEVATLVVLVSLVGFVACLSVSLSYPLECVANRDYWATWAIIFVSCAVCAPLYLSALLIDNK